MIMFLPCERSIIKWVTGIITLRIGVRTPLVTGDGAHFAGVSQSMLSKLLPVL